jgi:hypothetical protein
MAALSMDLLGGNKLGAKSMIIDNEAEGPGSKGSDIVSLKEAFALAAASNLNSRNDANRT